MKDLTDQVPACEDAERAGGGAGSAEHPAGEMLPATRSKVGGRARALAGLAFSLGAVIIGGPGTDTTPAGIIGS